MIILPFDGVSLQFDLMMTLWSTLGFPKFWVHRALGHYSTVCDIVRTRNNTRENNMLLYFSPIGRTAAGTLQKGTVKLRKVFILWSSGRLSLLGFISSIIIQHNLENNPENKKKHSVLPGCHVESPNKFLGKWPTWRTILFYICIYFYF
jgi:hypothetical protein